MSELPADEAELRRKVQDAVKDLRDALREWKLCANWQRPLFIYDGIPDPLSQDGLSSCRVWADRDSMVADLARGPVGAEIGVAQGDFSRHLLGTTGIKHLHLFDLTRRAHHDVLADPRVVFHQGDSSLALAALEDVTFDWIYIDGDHSLEGVTKDVAAALPRLRQGGLLFFNDYTRWSPGESIPYGIPKVVNGLVNEGWDMVGIALTWHGYFDVALRAPG